MPDQLNFQNIIRETRARLCLDCGKCTVVCPVTKYDTEFNPRLIVQNSLRPANNYPYDERIWSCINCNMCMERCNYNVKFTDFIRAVRAKVFAAEADVKYSHGGALQAIMHMMSHEGIKQNRLQWLRKNLKTDKKSETAFFVGCSPFYDVFFNQLDIKTTEGTNGALRLLQRAQVPFNILPNERCCGRDLLLLGDTAGFLSLAQANLEEFKQNGIRHIITGCPECFYTLKVDYPKYLDGWDITVSHITEMLTPLIESNILHLRKKSKKRITFHDPCTLGRYSRLFEPPRDLLKSITGVEMIEMKDNREKALCCGASPWAYCGAVNKQLQKERLAQAENSGAELLITACPKCLIHLKCAQKNMDNADVSQIEIQDLYEFAATCLPPQEDNQDD